MAVMENRFKKAAKSFYQHNLVAGKAETFIVHLLKNNKEGISYQNTSDIVVSEVDDGNEDESMQESTCCCCFLLIASAPIYRCSEKHLLCHICNSRLLHCWECGLLLLGERHIQGEKMIDEMIPRDGAAAPYEEGDVTIYISVVESRNQFPFSFQKFK